MGTCTLAEVYSPRKNVLDRKIFDGKDQKSKAMNFKTQIENDSDKKVKFKKVEC